MSGAPTTPTTRTPGRRLAELSLAVERVEAMLSPDWPEPLSNGDRLRAIAALRQATDDRDRYLLAQMLRRVADPIERAGHMVTMAVLSGSYVAAQSAERSHMALRAERELQRLEAAEAAALAVDPASEMGRLIAACLALPDAQRRELADAVGATVWRG